MEPNKLSQKELKEFLDEKYHAFNTNDFIGRDPISIPHEYSKKEDIEVAGFLAATIAWGQRKTIIRNARQLLEWMDHSPHDFILHAQEQDMKPFRNFKHRTFNGIDSLHFIKALHYIYVEKGGMEKVFSQNILPKDTNLKHAIAGFRDVFFAIPHEKRTEKHIANPLTGSSAKRLNLFLRWMTRSEGVDFGIWRTIPKSMLSCPLDVHSGTMARKLGLLQRKQNDWKAVEELDRSLRKLDPEDPVKYDIALFELNMVDG